MGVHNFLNSQYHGNKARHQIETNICALQKPNPKDPANFDFLQRIGRQQGTVSISSPSSLNTSQDDIVTRAKSIQTPPPLGVELSRDESERMCNKHGR